MKKGKEQTLKMALNVYNTLTRKKEEFVPLHDNRVNFYACGPTVYDYFHIGNARPLIMFDVFRRYLEFKGYDVNYIVNITDVDDKIINRAREKDVDFRAIARKYTDAFFEDCEKLGVLPATVNPRATEHIDAMLDIIRLLIEKKHAYIVEGDVYFDIESFPGYGKLSGRDIKQMQAGARVDVNDRKKYPLDFALWKAAKPDEPSWDSPWGPGRPGWHIECSVMAMQFAGDTLDIHAGGQDLIFPHHENEIAQSEGVTGEPFARYWLHNGFLDIEGEKMSKSLGNFLTVKDILKLYDPMAIRVFFLLKHYRSPIDFSEDRIREAQAALDRLRNTYRKMTRVIEKGEKEKISGSLFENQMNEKKILIEAAMDDDFNTARVMGYLFDVAKMVNNIGDDEPSAFYNMNVAKALFDEFGANVFGITFEIEAQTESIVDDLVQLFIDLRSDARKEKNWELADTIRERLNEIGIILEDRPDGTTWTS